MRVALTPFTLLALLTVAAPAEARRCTIDVVHGKRGVLRINGVAFPSFELAKLRRALGPPDRTITAKSKVRFERRGYRGGRSVSTMVPVTNIHYVYDSLGLVFSTRNTRRWSRSRRPARLYVVLRKKISFAHRDKPAVSPKGVFRGALRINGRRLGRGRLALPKGVSYRTRSFALFGATFAPTSRGTLIGSIYAYERRPLLRLLFDDAARRRVAYVRLR